MTDTLPARPLAAGQPYRVERHVLAGIPCLIECPDHDGPLSALCVVLHGAYNSKEGKLGVYPELCAHGVAVVLPDAALHGERQDPQHSPDVLGERNYVWTAAARTSHEMGRLIDALHAQYGPLPVWAVGSSMGGYTAQFLALQEPRVTRVAAVITAGVWQDPRATLPEARAYLDGFRPVQHARLAPPTALLLLNGTADEVFPLSAVEQTVQAYRAAYAQAGCPEQFEARLYEGVPHYTSRGMQRDVVRFLLDGLPTATLRP
ncbi:alpha/beta fold hydrolase [Deinococcus sonorensis]|uniref:Alpha/beta fold hydrolase n=2 Tax=Deinococcus sonorensis TaxID=309891 RepID=A0AAU7U9V8_9DEIO